jgi:hypothetical protein
MLTGPAPLEQRLGAGLVAEPQVLERLLGQGPELVLSVGAGASEQGAVRSSVVAPRPSPVARS